MTVSRPAVDVARGASLLIIQIVVNSAISLAAFAIIARTISREDMGSLAILTLIATAAQVLAGLGLGSTATQFVASLRGKGDFDGMSRAGYSCLVINASMTAVIACVAFFSADFLASSLLGTASRANLFRLLPWEIAALGANYSLGNILLGVKRFRDYSLSSMAGFAVRQSAVVALLVSGMGLPGILIGWGIGDSIVSLLFAAFVRKALGPFRLGFGFGKLLRFSSPLFFGEAANFAWSYFDRVLLIPLVSLAQLGAYNVAVTAYGVLNSLPLSISSALFPFYSHLYSGGNNGSGAQDLENAVKTASRYVSFLTIPLAVGLAVTSFPAATLLAGANYRDAVYPLAMLSMFLAIGCLVRALGPIFIVMGRTVTSAVVTIASILLPVLVGFLIIPQLGIVGASFARGLSLIIAFGLSVLLLKRLLKLRFDMRAYGYAWLASIAMGIATLTFELAIYSKYLLPVYILTGATVFLLSLRFLRAIDTQDIELLSGFLPKRLRFLAQWLAKALQVHAKPN